MMKKTFLQKDFDHLRICFYTKHFFLPFERWTKMDMFENEAKSDEKQNNLIGIEHTHESVCVQNVLELRERAEKLEFRDDPRV